MPEIIVNGRARRIEADSERPLLWVLRDQLGLRGTKYGCGVGVCGICTVLVDGEPRRSCVVAAAELGGRHVTTIEGLAEQGHPVLDAWIEQQVPQCGYCQPGQILSAAALLDRSPQPSDTEIDEAMGGVLCRCGTYQRIRRAIHGAARSPAGRAMSLPEPAPAGDAGTRLDDWIHIAPDGTVTVTVNHAEMGQGVATALATLVAEELEVDLERMRCVFAPADKRYRNPMFGEQTTGGSTSVRGEWERLSKAGAAARLRLVKAAARHWGVPQDDCRAERGAVVHCPSGRRLGYGELAPTAAGYSAPRRISLKPLGACRLLGRPLPRLDVPDLSAGRRVYGLDVSLPGLRVAAVSRSPVFGAILRGYDHDAALAIPGVEQVVAIERGVAVVATDAWSALRGREALKVHWDPGPNAELDNAALQARVAAALDRAGDQRQSWGEVDAALAGAAGQIAAQYATAPLAHATLEPMSCTARIDKGLCEVWVGTQSPELAQRKAAEVSGLPRGKVRIHSLYMGGAFGRRLEPDTVEEAVGLARATTRPVQVIWSRDDDLRHDFYRPAYAARLRARLDADGRPTAWFQRGAGAAVAGEGCGQLPYAIPTVQVEFVAVESPIPTGAWRAVGAGQDAFVVESFVDELARAAGHDPLEYRRALLGHAPRHLRVLELAAKEAGWSEPAPAGRYRGIALYASFGSHVAEVAEVSVHEQRITVHRVVCAVDCGRVINPEGVRAQIEGGVALGLSAALKEAVVLSGGAVQQATFEDYPILTLPEMPRVEVHIVDCDEEPGGVGEPGLPPIAPAVANAVAAATGVRLRTLPLRLDQAGPG